MLTYKGLCSTESSLYEQEFSPSVFHVLDTWRRSFILRTKEEKIFTDMHRKGISSSFPLLVKSEAEIQPFCISCPQHGQSAMGKKKSFCLISEIICSNHIHVTVTLEVSKHQPVNSRQISCTEQQLWAANNGVTVVSPKTSGYHKMPIWPRAKNVAPRCLAPSHVPQQCKVEHCLWLTSLHSLHYHGLVCERSSCTWLYLQMASPLSSSASRPSKKK